MGKEVTPISECEKAIVIVTPRSDVDAERPPLQAPRLPWRRAVPQVLASCAALSLALHAGVNMAMAAIMLPQMEAPDSAIRVDRDSASWIAAVVAVTTPVGSLASGPLMDVAGRRAACLWTAVPLVVAWLLLGLAAGPLPHVGLVYASRALAGLGGGLSTAAGVYVSETTHPSLRPALLCLNSVFVAAGILLVACLGLFLHWGWVAVVSACAAAGSGLAVLRLCPESPHWLLHMAPGRHAVYAERRASLARESLLRLNKNPSEAEAAWDRLIASPVKATEAGTQKSLRSLAVILQPASAKPMLILTAIFVVQQLSGTYVIIFYAVPLFAKIGSRMGTVFDEFSVMVIMSAVRFVMSLLTVLLSRRLGRRTMLIFSGLGMAVCSVAAGATLVAAPAPAASNTTDSVLSSGEAFEASWTPLLLIITIVMFSSLGYLVLPWSLVSELLPLGSRAVGSGLLVSLAYLLMFGVVKSFPYLMAMVGARTIFYLFGGVAFAGTVFVFFYLPETLGRSLEEIEAVFVKRTSERASQREAAITTKS